MNERDELAGLKQEQARLEKELGLVSLRLTRLERRLNRTEEAPQAAVAPIENQRTVSPGATQPPSPALPRQETSAVPPQPVLPSATPGAVPPVISQASAPGSQILPPPSPALAAEKATIRRAPLPGPERTAPSPAAAAPPKRSLELQLGTYWAPRIGIVVLLTGLVFLGNLAYQKLGATGKVLLLYGASAILLGAGAWWQRRGRDSLKNYAQVLFAGGLAALYFTTYAAHHLESLRVIQSTQLDGFLLLGCAAFMVWTADRWRSEVLAVFGIGLAYYTCVMTRVGTFTLYSNLVLTIAAVLFLVRNRWLGLTFGSLLATYAAYAFWRFFNGAHWHWASAEEGLWGGIYFLAAYWVVFTAGVFLSRDEKFAGQNRAAFLSLNNGAFFASFVLTMLQVDTGGFWRFCLVYGAVLVGLAEAARIVFKHEPATKNFYLTQGLLLITVGFISKFAGLKLALVLAAESVVLLMLAHNRRNTVLFFAAYIVSALAVGWGMDGMLQNDKPGLYLALGLGTLMIANTLLTHHFMQTSGNATNDPAPTLQPFNALSTSTLRPQVAYFVILALAVWLVATWNNVARENFPLILAAEGLVLTFSLYLVRVREITLFAQSYFAVAILAWLARWADTGSSPVWWNPLLLLAILLVVSHWWQRQTLLQAPAELSVSAQLLFALSIVGLLYFWIMKLLPAEQWLATTSGLAVVLTLYAALTGAWLIAACGQLFLLASCLQFAWQLLNGHPPALLALAPMATLALLSGSTMRWFQTRPEASPRVRDPLLQTALVYRWVALPMAIAWVFEYVPDPWQILALATCGLVAFLIGGWKRNSESLLFSAGFTVTAFAAFWFQSAALETITWMNLVAILFLLVEQQVAARFPQLYKLAPQVHTTAILVGGITLWWFCTRWVLQQPGGFYLTAGWSLLALLFFTCGIVLRERIYRWLGLGLLALALGRIVIVDVWRLEMLYRILSFMALGLVLLVLGFIYSKYQEKIRQWL